MFRKYWVPTPRRTSQTSTSPTWDEMLGHSTYSPDPIAPASSSTLGPSTFFMGNGSGRSVYSTAGTCLSGISAAVEASPRSGVGLVMVGPPPREFSVLDSVVLSGHPLIGRNRQEVLVVLGQRHLREERPGIGLLPVGLLVDQPLDELASHLLAVGQGRAGVQPLPHLGAGDLCGRGVLHQVVDADRAG